MAEPLVYIVLVNYNGYQDTVECVESLKKISYGNYRIVIVENASKDAETLRNDSFLNENAVILYAEENGGFSEGNNIGIRYAIDHDADYVLLLNNDTVVTESFLDALVETAESDPSVGIVTGNIKYYYNPEAYWYIGGDFFRSTGYSIMTKFAKDMPSQPHEVSFATGCLMLIRADYIRKHNGYLSNEYFLYSEDTDYCCAVIDHGYKIMWTPKCLIYHKVNASIGKSSTMQQYYFVRNYLIVARKYGTCFPLAYITRMLLSGWEMMKYHFSPKIVMEGFRDYHRKVTGRSSQY